MQSVTLTFPCPDCGGSMERTVIGAYIHPSTTHFVRQTRCEACQTLHRETLATVRDMKGERETRGSLFASGSLAAIEIFLFIIALCVFSIAYTLGVQR